MACGVARQMSSHVTQASLADDAQQQQVRDDVTTNDVIAQSLAVTELQEGDAAVRLSTIASVVNKARQSISFVDHAAMAKFSLSPAFGTKIQRELPFEDTRISL